MIKTSEKLKSYLHPKLAALAFFLWLLGVAGIFYKAPWLDLTRLSFFALFLALALPQAKRFSLILFVPVVLLASWFGLGTGNWLPLQRGLDFALFFTLFLPPLMLIRETLKVSPQIETSKERFTQLSSEQRAAGLTTGSLIVGSVLTLGAVAMLSTLSVDEKDIERRREAATSVLRGLSLVLPWTPFTAGIVFCLTYRPSVTLLDVMLVGVPMALIGLTISHVLFSRHLSPKLIVLAFKAFTPILLPVAVAIVVVACLASFTPLKTVEAIALAIPPLCLIWLSSMGTEKPRPTLMSAYQRLGDTGDDLMIFAGACTMGYLLASLPFVETFVYSSGLVTAPLPVIFLFVLIFAPVTAMIGCHPVVSASVLTVFLTPLDGRLTDIVEVQMLLFVWGTASMLSFASMSMVATSRFFQVPSKRLMLHRNVLFTIIFGTICGSLAYILF